MKIVFLLFSHLTEKKIFPHVHIRNISPPGQDLGGKILREAYIQDGWHKPKENWLSFVVFEHIRAWFSFYVWGDFTGGAQLRFLFMQSRVVSTFKIEISGQKNFRKVYFPLFAHGHLAAIMEKMCWISKFFKISVRPLIRSEILCWFQITLGLYVKNERIGRYTQFNSNSFLSFIFITWTFYKRLHIIAVIFIQQF